MKEEKRGKCKGKKRRDGLAAREKNKVGEGIERSREYGKRKGRRGPSQHDGLHPPVLKHKSQQYYKRDVQS